MSDVFVSYKAEDRRRVKPLVEALHADGYSVWWDEQIGGGAAWRQAIETELNAAKCVIVIWSNRSVGPDGTFVQDEATRAQQRHVYVPVLFDKVHLPLGFGETQALPLTGWHGKRDDPRYQAVLDAVRRNVGIKRRPGAPRVPQPQVNRRTMIAGGAVTAIVVAGVGGWELLKPSSASAAGSIAVLPFENLSGDPSQAYFADGVAEEIRSALSRLGGLTVIGRTSSEAVRTDDAPTAAKKLGVASILTGSVRQSPSTIRISAELVDGRTGADRWSQNYDRAPGDSIKIQTDIAQNVASALSAAFGSAVRKAIEIGGTQNPTAQDLYLRTDPSHGDESAEGLQSAIARLDQALRLDPNYARAYARKGRTLAFYAAVYAKGVDQSRTAIAEAAREAAHAITLAPNLTEAHSALSFIYRQQLEFKEALRESQIAVNLPGTDAGAMGNYAILLAQSKDGDQALNVIQRAAALDPLNPGTFESEALIFFLLHRFEAAAAAARHALQLGPTRSYARGVLGYCLTLMRRFPQAEAEIGKLSASDVHRLFASAVIASLSGDNKSSDRIVQQMRGQYGDAASYQYAGIYAQRRDVDRAIDALKKAVDVRDPGLAVVQADPFLDPIRGDPRLSAIIKGLDFPS